MLIYYVLYNTVSDEYYSTNDDQLLMDSLDTTLFLHRAYVPLEFYIYTQAEAFVAALPDYYAYEIIERTKD